jgi:hypothetical protein
LNPVVPPSSAALHYLEFLGFASLPRVGQPELFPRGPSEVDELAWQSRWFSGDFGREFTTLAGEPVRVLDFGWWNHGAGPDFRDCVVEIAGTAQRGSIEIDLTPRDWEAHGHAANPAYNDTLLHLFFAREGDAKFYTRTSENREVPQVVLDPAGCETVSNERSAPARPGRCVQALASLPEARVLRIMEDAARWRLERKARRLRRVAGIHGLDQAIYQGIAEALGYSRNKLPMNVLAQRLPLRFLQKRPDDAEALLYGVAGFLDGREGDHGDDTTRAWLRGLWQSWWRYRAELTPGTPARPIKWTLSGTRPVNHPQRRIAALWQIVVNWKSLRRLLEPAAFHEQTFIARLEELSHPYWTTHYTLTAKPAPAPLALLGAQRVRDIMANLVYPLLISDREELWPRYQKLPAPVESTRTTVAGLRLFGSAECAKKFSTKLWHHQALLQIYEDFCLADAAGCEGCPFPEQVQS